MWENVFIMPIIAKGSALITSVDTFIRTCTFSSVPSTKCDVYLVSFVFFFLFITQTAPNCNQTAVKAKTILKKSRRMVGGAIVSACFLFTFSLHFLLTLLSVFGLIQLTFRRFTNTAAVNGMILHFVFFVSFLCLTALAVKLIPLKCALNSEGEVIHFKTCAYMP